MIVGRSAGLERLLLDACQDEGFVPKFRGVLPVLVPHPLEAIERAESGCSWDSEGTLYLLRPGIEIFKSSFHAG